MTTEDMEKASKPAPPATSNPDGEVSHDYSHSGTPTTPTTPHEHKTTTGSHTVAEELPIMTRLGLTMDSFKPRNYGHVIVELDRAMKARHLHMIAIGGSIGAGFFVGSGSALSTGGPGALLVDFLLIGVMMFNVVYALGEMAVVYPVSGGFYTYSTRFIDPSWGFAMVSWVPLWQLTVIDVGATGNLRDERERERGKRSRVSQKAVTYTC